MFFVCLMAIDNEEERSSIEALYEKYKYHCLHMAMMQIDNIDDAEDIVQEAFLRIIRHKKKYLTLSRADFEKLLVVIIRNLVADYYRHENVIRANVYDFSVNTVADEVSMEDRIIMRVEAENALKKLEKLDSATRSIICYRCIDIPLNAIADTMKMTKKNVEMKLYRARKKLKADLEGGGIFE